MFDLIIYLFKFIFVFSLASFLLNSVLFILNERHLCNFGANFAVHSQRIVILVFALSGFLILSYEMHTPHGIFPLNLETLLNGMAVLVFFAFAFVTTNKLSKGCPLLWNGLFFLLCIGFVMLQRLNPVLFRRQLIFCLLGFIVALLIPLILRIVPRFEKLELLYLMIGAVLLLTVFIPNLGTEEFGASNWVKIGNLSFQPSEFVKVLFVFYLASAFYKSKRLLSARIIIAISAAASFVVILVLQRDLGGALIYSMVFIIMFYIASGKLMLIIGGLLAVSVVSFLVYHLFPQFFSHVTSRITAWQNPWADIDNTGYQITQSFFAITTWGSLGAGLSKGSALFIPVVERDMIFAAICEEFGGIFGILLIGVYIVVFYRGVYISLRSTKRLYSLLSVGITALLAFQTFVILGGVTNLIPLTGVTLPFISYGGSSVFISIIMIGVLEWLFTRIPVVVIDGDKEL